MSSGNRIKHTFRLPPALSRRLAAFALHKHVSQASVVEAALEAFLSPDGPERREAVLGRRLDRITRQLDRLGYHVDIGNEALALYVKRWLIMAPALGAEDAGTRAEAEGRFAQFIQALAHRMEGSRHLPHEVDRVSDFDGSGAE